jgi:hypothetical protein
VEDRVQPSILSEANIIQRHARLAMAEAQQERAQTDGMPRVALKRRTKMRWSVLAVLAALLAAPLVMAQEGGVVENIPFPFIAAGKTLAAGEWTLMRVGTGAAHIWTLRNGRKYAVLLVANSVYKPLDGDTKLTFNRYGQQYFLSEIWLPGQTGYTIYPCKQERALRVAGVKPERTVMFARLR